MGKQNTQLQELIKTLEDCIKTCDEQVIIFKNSQMYSQMNTSKSMLFAYSNIKRKAESLLEKEEQAIVDAFNNAVNTCIQIQEKGIQPKITNGVDYYQNKFK